MFSILDRCNSIGLIDAGYRGEVMAAVAEPSVAAGGRWVAGGRQLIKVPGIDKKSPGVVYNIWFFARTTCTQIQNANNMIDGFGRYVK